MQRSLQYVGLSLVVLGAMLTVVPTGSFSTIAGDRPVDVAVAGDGDAFLAIVDTNNEVTKPGSSVTVAELENNLNSSMTVEYEASVDTDSLSVATPADTTTIRQGGREPLEVTCSPPNGGSGTATLTVDVIEAAGQSAVIRDATLEAPVEYDCPGRTSGSNAAIDPGSPPGDAVAYVDADHDYAYDEGERIVPRDEVPTFDNDSAHLVVAAGGETLSYSRIAVSAKSLTVGDTTLGANKELTLTAASDAVSLKDATLDSKNARVEVSGPTVTLGGAEIAAEDDATLTADAGPLTVADSPVDSKNGEVRLTGRSIDAVRSTLAAEGAVTATATAGAIDVSDASVDSKNGQIRLTGDSITADGATIAAGHAVTLTAEAGSSSLVGASVESKNGEIAVTADDSLAASSATFDTNAAIDLASSGDMTLDGTEISSKNGHATLALGRSSATLSVDNAVLRDRDSTVVYTPSGVTVDGTPAKGNVQAG